MHFKVTIILATYNRANLIAETLRSIERQTYANFECLIIDDGGRDNTVEVIAPFLEDRRFRFLKRPEYHKKGLPGCRNYGLEKAKGNYVIFYDDDDIVHPQNLEISLKILSENKGSHFCHFQKQSFTGDFEYNQITFIDKFNQTGTNKSIMKKMLRYEVPMASCTVLWRKKCFNDNFFNESLQYAEEWECYQRILSTYWKGIILDCTLYYNRKHQNSNTGEFWSNNKVKNESKRKAIILIIENLNEKNLLSPSLLKYLAGISISCRDKPLLDKILLKAEVSLYNKTVYNFKFLCFPFYRKLKWLH
ncbi:glycosyltransferase family 2 protein [Aequorivita sp. F47161]|uniref:Glycosyltransferase family 2 protein n=1 Tax=Aequorivita vitellina TaxID=2874475 RepID=A0A9X1QX33_9FLAO|nr:glycosyltransferase family 2 protein [Aequorivita vitellina]